MANHILIGLGGTGYKVLRDFRKRLWEEYPDVQDRERLPVRFLYVDSDENATPAKLAGNDDLKVNGLDTAITPNEYLGIKNVDLNAMFASPAAYPTMKHVLGATTFLKNALGNVGAAAGQKRRAGRILFAASVHEYINKLKYIIKDLQQTIGNANELEIHIFAGLAGGTGSGSIVDAVAQILVHFPAAKLEVFAMIPEQLPPTGADAGRYHANGYAALSELSALNVGAFLPSDVSSGAEHIQLPNPNENKQFGLTVYTNVNRNGVVVDSFKTLPALIADTMYFRIFNKPSEAMIELDKYFKSENRLDYVIEYKTNTRNGQTFERARSKAIGSFGIKRLRYPSDKLTLHASENVARTVMAMMLYKNYDNDRGYLNEKPAQARDYGEYLNKANLKNWQLSDADLSLSVPILPPANGKPVPTFDDFWRNEVALDYSYASAKEMGQPLAILEQYFDERYKEGFRDEKGVEQYFMAKANPVVVKDSAATIVHKIRTNLFSQWQTGQYSALDVRLITEQILALLQAKNRGIDAEIVELDNEIDAFVKDRAAILDEYMNTGLIIGFLKRSKENLFKEYADLLTDEYVARTRRASLQIFQKALLPKLIQQFMDLQAEVQKFVGRMDESVGDLASLIGANTPEREPDLRDNKIEVADLERLAVFEKDLLHDRQKMETMAQKFRDRMAEGAGSSFETLTKCLSSPAKIEKLAHEVLDELVSSYHAELMRQKPVLGLNVLEQLYQMYGHSEDAIGKFATEIVNNSGVFITLDQQAVNKNMPNTDNPTQITAAGPNSILMVAIPNLETDDEELSAFVEKLKIKLRQAYDASDTRKFYFYESPVPEEITIVAYENVFPARTIDYMPFLRRKYEALTQSPNEAANITNSVVLHIEGDGTQLPPLFGEGDGPTGDALIKYLFLAVAFNILRKGEDELGNKGWGLVTTDTWGIEKFSLLSPKITGLLTSQGYTPEVNEQLVDGVDAALAKPRHVNEKEAMSSIVRSIMRDFVLPESGSPNSALFRQYSAQATAALDALK